jgi:hypothetical protein
LLIDEQTVRLLLCKIKRVVLQCLQGGRPFTNWSYTV